MRLGTPRDPALTLVLIFLTCGIYYLYFIYVVSQETQEFLGEPEISPGVEVLLSVITCGIWNIAWDYRMGKRAAVMCERVGLPVTDNSTLYLVLDLVGVGGFGSLGIVNPVLQQETLNRIWKAAMTGPAPHPPRRVPGPPPRKCRRRDSRAPSIMNPSSRSNAGGIWSLLTAIFAAAVLMPLPGQDGRIAHLPAFCPFYLLTGLPCPGCGLTRAFVCLGHGQWRESLHWHPLGWLVFLVLAGVWLRSGAYWLRGIRLFSLSPTALSRLSWAGVAVLFLFGAARIGWLTAHHLRF